MLSNFDLEELATFYNIEINEIVSKDELPRKPIDGGYIINLQSEGVGDGTHWCCFYLHKKEAVYFDSFGATPPVEVETFIKKRKGVHLYYNNWIIQDLKSDYCGWFCLACLIFINNKMKEHDLYTAFNTFINGFSGRTNQNDSILKSFYYGLNNKGKPPKTLKNILHLL